MNFARQHHCHCFPSDFTSSSSILGIFFPRCCSRFCCHRRNRGGGEGDGDRQIERTAAAAAAAAAASRRKLMTVGWHEFPRQRETRAGECEMAPWLGMAVGKLYFNKTKELRNDHPQASPRMKTQIEACASLVHRCQPLRNSIMWYRTSKPKDNSKKKSRHQYHLLTSQVAMNCI